MVADGVFQLLINEVAYKALPDALVEKIELDVGHMKVGDSIKVKDLEIAKDQDVDLVTDPETVVAVVSEVHNKVPETETETETEE